MEWDGTWCQWALGLVDFHQVPLDQVVWGTIANEVWFEIVMQGVLNLLTTSFGRQAEVCRGALWNASILHQTTTTGHP